MFALAVPVLAHKPPSQMKCCDLVHANFLRFIHQRIALLWEADQSLRFHLYSGIAFGDCFLPEGMFQHSDETIWNKKAWLVLVKDAERNGPTRELDWGCSSR